MDFSSRTHRRRGPGQIKGTTVNTACWGSWFCKQVRNFSWVRIKITLLLYFFPPLGLNSVVQRQGCTAAVVWWGWDTCECTLSIWSHWHLPNTEIHWWGSSAWPLWQVWEHLCVTISDQTHQLTFGFGTYMQEWGGGEGDGGEAGFAQKWPGQSTLPLWCKDVLSS